MFATEDPRRYTPMQHSPQHDPVQEQDPAAAISPFKRLKAAFQGGGAYYALLYVMRWLGDRFVTGLDRRLVAVEQRKGLVEPWAISARRFTSLENKQLWNKHDWSQLGEEWTRSPQWKEQIVQEFLFPNVRE